MNNKHLTEQLIQDYLWDRNTLSAEDLQHIATCNHCLARANDYQLLFRAVEKTPKPSFDFDLAAAVLPQVGKQPATGRQTFAWRWTATAAIFVVLLLAIPVYIFRDDIFEIVTNASIMITWLIIMMVALIALFLGIDEYRKYDQRLNSLDTQ